MPKFLFNKLVRDNTLKELESEGIEVKYEKLSKENLMQHLKNKLLEEVNEVLTTNSNDELISEMVDVYDVLEAICKESRIEHSEIEEKRMEKNAKRGGFSSGIFIHYVETSSDDSSEYFRNSPDKYPVIE